MNYPGVPARYTEARLPYRCAVDHGAMSPLPARTAASEPTLG